MCEYQIDSLIKKLNKLKKIRYYNRSLVLPDQWPYLSFVVYYNRQNPDCNKNLVLGYIWVKAPFKLKFMSTYVCQAVFMLGQHLGVAQPGEHPTRRTDISR